MSKLLYKTTMPNLTNVDAQQCLLLLIDPQIDFHEGGSLAVAGATLDSIRISEMMRKNVDKIDQIYVTLDTHHRNHIAHQSFWVAADGSLSKPVIFNIFTKDDVGTRWLPRDSSLKDHCIQYITDLSKLMPPRNLMIWPDHCLIGSDGHAIVQTINDELSTWSSYHQDRDINYIHKGMNCLTEMYSAIKADVPNCDPSTHANERLLAELRRARKLVVCGQAMSHCVNFTVRDIVDDWKKHNKDRSALYILSDGASCVTNCQKLGDDFIADMRKEGVTISDTSTVFNVLF